MITTNDNLLHGSCLCGGIVFHAALPALGANHCYCTMCQQFHGAAAGSYINVASSGFVVEQGADLIVDYASSAQARRGFCKTCGSSLYWRSTETPEVIDLSLGTLQPAWTGDVTRELYLESKPTWLPRR